MKTQRQTRDARQPKRGGTRKAGRMPKRAGAGVTPTGLVRLRPGLSLRALSDRTGISLSLLSRLFAGKRRLTVRVARLLAEALEMSTDAVMDALAPRLTPPA